MTGTVILQDPRNHIAETASVDQLIRYVSGELASVGVSAHGSKVSRLVRRWVERVRFTGYGLAEWVADGLALDAQQRAKAAERMKVISYADPTGNTAVANVKRERGY